MANIRVRVGQRQGVKVISSNKAAGSTVGGSSDVDTTARANRTFLMWDSTASEYVHVDAAQIVDLADGVDDDAYDGGTW
jgi:hypothetical protein